MTRAGSHTQAALPASPQQAPLLEIRDLAVSFEGTDRRCVQAVDGVSLSVHPAQTVALVGESGCGKSVTALSVMRLMPQPPARFDRGSIVFDGRDLLSLPQKHMLGVRGRDIAMIFQEPMTSLNPVFSVGEQIIEAVLLHQEVNRKQAQEIALAAMNEVGIPRPVERLKAYPHQLSGGMRQRVMIAMALACHPRLLIADEPTTALDVTIQAQLLELLHAVQAKRGMAMLLITHDLGVVAQNADVVCVMYAGRIVEYARVFDLFGNPMHPYTRALLQCKPKLGEKRARLMTIAETVSDPAEFERLPGTQRSATPWWPTERNSGAFYYCQVEPEHWVGCRSPAGEDDVLQRPATAFRRVAAAV